MEKIIVIEGKRKYQYKDFKSLVRDFVCENYYEMSKEERMEELEKRTVANTFQRNINVVKFEKGNVDIKEDEFVLYNEITYILSLAKFNIIVFLERMDANVFGRFINKPNTEDNYIIINKFADEIMRKYLKDK